MCVCDITQTVILKGTTFLFLRPWFWGPGFCSPGF